MPPEPQPTKTTAALTDAAATLRDAADAMRFGPPVRYVYNPLRYAWANHAAYLRRFARGRREVVMLGMNPGPWGMAQTGVPFGEVAAVRDWMKLDHAVIDPPLPGEPGGSIPGAVSAADGVGHPKRLVHGTGCTRSEVSGRRFWGLMAERFGPPEAFFARHFLVNYFPLMWLGETGRNLTPDKLPRAERDAVTAAGDAHLAALLRALRPRWVVGVGGFATKRAAAVVESARLTGIEVATLLHPSPASPAANRGWAEQATRQLEAAGVW
ncbi:MAG: uracil-DNA glycosylase family protein [Planctomycetota bacterium]